MENEAKVNTPDNYHMDKAGVTISKSDVVTKKEIKIDSSEEATEYNE